MRCGFEYLGFQHYDRCGRFPSAPPYKRPYRHPFWLDWKRKTIKWQQTFTGEIKQTVFDFYPSTQWAAVRMWRSLITVPPQPDGPKRTWIHTRCEVNTNAMFFPILDGNNVYYVPCTNGSLLPQSNRQWFHHYLRQCYHCCESDL